jgi:two-component system response regulator MprA
VVDDDPAVAATLERVLRAEGYTVDVTHQGHAALRLAEEHRPDLVILDVMMPILDGFAVCRRLRAEGATPVLMLTALGDVDERVRGLDSGADDYLAKPFAYQELLARVRALLRRTGPDISQRPHLTDLTADVGTRQAWRGDRELQLTAREFDLLVHFLRHPRQVLTREQLLDAVWQSEPDSDNVVAVYVGYLRQKLEEDGSPRLLHTVRGVGYALRPG